MTRHKYKALREKFYKVSGEVGTMAELETSQYDHAHLAEAYARSCEALDAIDALGVSLGFIDPETNDFTDRRYKMEHGDRMNK